MQREMRRCRTCLPRCSAPAVVSTDSADVQALQSLSVSQWDDEGKFTVMMVGSTGQDNESKSSVVTDEGLGILRLDWTTRGIYSRGIQSCVALVSLFWILFSSCRNSRYSHHYLLRRCPTEPWQAVPHLYRTLSARHKNYSSLSLMAINCKSESKVYKFYFLFNTNTFVNAALATHLGFSTT